MKKLVITMQSVQYYSDLPYFVTFFFKQIKAILTLTVKACLLLFFSPVQLQRAVTSVGVIWWASVTQAGSTYHIYLKS